MAPSSNIIKLPFRKSTHLSFKSAVTQYISSKYDQHPDMFRNDLDMIDAHRRDAINVREPHASGLYKLQVYAAQLVWMGTKFPVDIGCDFSWYPALGYNTDRPIIKNNLKFELINILFNLAALYSQLAVACNRGSSDGLKTAAKYFMEAAGILEHIKTNIIPDLRTDPPDDMDDHALDSLSQLFLAQAQECYWHKAVNDGLKDHTIAKLAAQVSDFYANAGDQAVQSQAISSPWIHHMSAKHHHFAAAAQYRAARACLERRQYGEEIARLKDALACVREGLKELKGNCVSPTVQSDLMGLEEKAKEDLKRAEKDNDLIYLQLVPDKTELKILDRAKMAHLKCPPEAANPVENMGDGAPLGPALFSKLVPFAVHMAVSLYEDNKRMFVEERIISQLDTMEEQLREDLTGLNLPASLQALEKPLGLPSDVLESAEAVQQERALETIPAAFAKIDDMRRHCCQIFLATQDILAAEEQEDETKRRKYGTDRWSRAPSREDQAGSRLWGKLTELEQYLDVTSQSDAKIRDNFDNIEPILRLLSGSRQGLLNFVPSSRRTEIPQTLVPVIGRLRTAYNDILRLQSRRRKKIESLQLRANQDDVKPDILQEAHKLERMRPDFSVTAADFDSFSDQRLTTLYGGDLDSLSQEAESQARILEEITKQNREFERQKKAAGDKGLGGQERQNALQELEEGYRAFLQVKKDVEGGFKFYNDLMKMVDQLHGNVNPWVEARRREARDLEAELTMPQINELRISNPASPSQGPPPTTSTQFTSPQPRTRRQQQQQQQQQQRQPRMSSPNRQPAPPKPPTSPPQEPQLQSWASQTVVPQQPRPVPGGTRWTPDMGIKFGTPGPGSAVPPTGSAAAPNVGQGKSAVPGTWDQNKPLRFG